MTIAFNLTVAVKRMASMFFIMVPFYWFPGVSLEVISSIKAVFLVGFSALVLITCLKLNGAGLSAKSTRLFLLWFFVSGLYGFVNLDGAVRLLSIVSYTFIFFMAGQILSRVGHAVWRPGWLEFFLAIFYFFAMILMIASAFISSSAFINPYYLGIDFNHNLYGYPYLYETGYVKARTHWAIAGFMSSLYLFVIADNAKGRLKYIFYVSGLAGICTLFITTSRGGLVFVVILLVFFGYHYFRSYYTRYFYVCVFVLCSLFVYFLAGDYLRIKGVEDITTGRGSGYILWFTLIQDNFIFGMAPNGGYTLKDYGLKYDWVHNVWMHYLLMYGFFVSFPIIVFFFFVLRFLFRRLFVVKIPYQYSAILLSGAVATFIEPEAIFSKAHYSLFWWTVAGYCFGCYQRTAFRQTQSVSVR